MRLRVADEPPSGDLAVQLDSPQPKFSLLLLSAVVAFATLLLTIRSFFAYRYGHTENVASLHHAAVLEPGNAARHHWLGRVALFVDQDHHAAVRELQEATRLNPWLVEYWLDLALAYKATGDSAAEGRALENALQAEPKNLNAAISEGNFYLSRGETDAAMRLFRVVLENDPPEPISVIDNCWRATHNVDSVLQALPVRANLHFRFLELLVRYGEAESAAKVWERLISLSQPFQSGKPVAYVDWLIQNRQPAAARTAWDQIQQIVSQRAATPDLLVNPGFEDDLQNVGFDWRFVNGGAVSFDQDGQQAHSGKRSLAITYTGASINDSGVWQLFPATPGETMRLSAFVKTEDLRASEAPRLGVEDFYKHALIATGPPVANSATWQPTSVEFRVPPDCHLLAFKIVLGAEKSRIKGTIWVDDFQLSRTKIPDGKRESHT